MSGLEEKHAPPTSYALLPTSYSLCPITYELIDLRTYEPTDRSGLGVRVSGAYRTAQGTSRPHDLQTYVLRTPTPHHHTTHDLLPTP
ncbi:MAG: hypothetical protein AMXMBFR16_06630 [Candidatus Uhrbacteria bacterium]